MKIPTNAFISTVTAEEKDESSKLTQNVFI